MATKKKDATGNPKEQLKQQTKKTLMGRDFVKNNESFTTDQILEVFDAFDCFVDPRSKLMNVGSLISCASSLGLDEKHPTILKVLQGISDELGEIDFETFVNELTKRLGSARSREGRHTLFNLIDTEGSGEVTMDNLRSLAKEVGHIISEEELKEVMDNISKGEPITYEEFERYLSRKLDR
mmetsp:Transcript_63439/g.73809  ORF Transcript_63439/g.73809 Transcript_63439/m.73809 type:complete len:181 (-) Transcript_63439:196-738(-)